MIENARSGLLWKLLMSCPEVRHGLRRLDFESPLLTDGLSQLSPGARSIRGRDAEVIGRPSSYQPPS